MRVVTTFTDVFGFEHPIAQGGMQAACREELVAAGGQCGEFRFHYSADSRARQSVTPRHLIWSETVSEVNLLEETMLP